MRTHYLISLAAASLLACSSDDPGAPDAAAGGRSGDSGNDDGASGEGGSSGSGGSGGSGALAGTGVVDEDGGVDPAVNDPWMTPEVLELCGGPCQCTDGIDNDMDGLLDGFDAECTGGTDNDEGTFATGIPGDNMDPKWQDCFFDGNSGAGNDGCRYSTDCLTGDLPQDDPDCTVTQMCIDYCKPRTPNGCDCFGCCTFTLADGSLKSVVLTAACEEETLDGCIECVPNETGCSNECGTCELCPGRTVDELPDSCTPPQGGAGGNGGSGGAGGNGGSGGSAGSDPPGYTCDDGLQVCGAQGDCPAQYFCSFGCCVISVD